MCRPTSTHPPHRTTALTMTLTGSTARAAKAPRLTLPLSTSSTMSVCKAPHILIMPQEAALTAWGLAELFLALPAVVLQITLLKRRLLRAARLLPDFLPRLALSQ